MTRVNVGYFQILETALFAHVFDIPCPVTLSEQPCPC